MIAGAKYVGKLDTNNEKSLTGWVEVLRFIKKTPYNLESISVSRALKCLFY